MWPVVIAGSISCYALKLLGFSVPRQILDSERARNVAALLPVALLAALALTQSLSTGHHLTLDARAGGLVAAVACTAKRAPFLITVAVAVAVTAGLRAWT
ncbi:MAG: AzlD domain-containing protein [Acidimicrobiales bacterium]|jgi:branched-subunit amino acid transport protein